ncbi:MAG: type II toxin-antitoxin system PemK/MazF family toxin [Alphaproteobacteria bacterium]|nr:type II toxin-antitoxin system PemK/MazF family toxin [Alphaproteobacteria bacterium]
MERGDIYFVSLDPAVGPEQQGRRPVLVVTPGKFNKVTGLPVVVPITSGGKFARSIGFAVSLSGTGTRTIGIIRCDQPRVLDVKARGGRRVERAPEAIVDEVLAKISPMFEA